MLKSNTPAAVMWTISARCPRCNAPITLRQTASYQPFLACTAFPRCRFTSAYDRMIHALLDKIIALQDRLEDAGFTVERSLP